VKPRRSETGGASAATARPLRWVLAGGGTGGHVMPALALAERLREAEEPVLFIGARRGLETRLVPEAGFELVALDARPLVGQSLVGSVRNLFALARATLAARRAIRAFHADLVISVGGYAAVPAALGARLARVPLVILEANAVPGLANRAVARFAERIFVGFAPAAARLGRGAGDPRVQTSGLPLRRSLLAAFAGASAPREPAPPLRLFVFGGSQGARQINEALVALLPRLDPKRLSIVHQTGEADRSRVAQAYEKAGFQAEVVAFERDMAARYRWADLVVCRAGALTVAELGLAGRAAILVPLAHVGGGEQVANARVLEACDAAQVLDARGDVTEALGRALESLLDAPERLVAMGRRAASTAQLDAAERIVAASRELVTGSPPATAPEREESTG